MTGANAMNKHTARTWNATDIGEGFEEVARQAVADGPVTVVQPPAGEDMVILSKREFERDYRLTPQAYVRRNKVSQEAADLMDEITREMRADSVTPYGV